MGTPEFAGYAGKLELAERFARGRNVLHLGAVGETCGETELRVEKAHESVHAFLTRVAARCIGVDNDEPSVRLLTERGVFHNLLLADVTELKRDDVDLPLIDTIFVGDTIEHLAEPGRLLEIARSLADPTTRLLVTTPNALGLGIFLRSLSGRPYEGPDHVVSFNASTLVQLLARRGWEVDELWSCHQANATSLHRTWFRAGKALFARWPRLGGTLFAVARLGSG